MRQIGSRHGDRIDVALAQTACGRTIEAVTVGIMANHRWIVVGMDFSDGAVHALNHALHYAATAGASVACVHAYEDAPGATAVDEHAVALRAQLEAAIALRARSHESVRVDPIVRRGAPWEKLNNVATELGADLIVVGAEGQRGAMGGGVLGSVASRILTTSPRSVLVVRRPRGLADES